MMPKCQCSGYPLKRGGITTVGPQTGQGASGLDGIGASYRVFILEFCIIVVIYINYNLIIDYNVSFQLSVFVLYLII